MELFAGVFILFALFTLAFIGGIIFLIVVVIKKSTQPLSAGEKAQDQKKMLADVQQRKQSLASWNNRGPEVISSAMKYRFSKGFSNRLKGTIYSQDKEAIVAFNRMEKGFRADGYMFASTSEFDLFYKFKDGHFQFYWNGELFGYLRRDGSLYNTDKQLIGSAKHPPKTEFNISVVKVRTGDNQFPVTINEKMIATINVAPNYSGGISTGLIFGENQWGNQIVEVHESISEEEKKWLILLGVLEVAFHGHWMI